MCRLLVDCLSNHCLDSDSKLRLSIAGYVYRAVWNYTVKTCDMNSLDLTMIRATALSVSAAGLVTELEKFTQQLHIVYTHITRCVEDGHSRVRAASDILQSALLVASRRQSDNSAWLCLSLYIDTMVNIHFPTCQWKVIFHKVFIFDLIFYFIAPKKAWQKCWIKETWPVWG